MPRSHAVPNSWERERWRRPTWLSGELKRDPKARLRVNRDWATAYNELAWKSFLELPKDMLGESLPKAEAALDLVQKAIDLAPDNQFALDTRGSIYRAMGRIDEALADFDKAIRNGITAPSTYLERGRCHEQKGNMELAVADYKRAAELPPRINTPAQPRHRPESGSRNPAAKRNLPARQSAWRRNEPLISDGSVDANVRCRRIAEPWAYSSSAPGVFLSMKCPNAEAIGLAGSSCHACASKATTRRPCFTIETLAWLSSARPERR